MGYPIHFTNTGPVPLDPPNENEHGRIQENEMAESAGSTGTTLEPSRMAGNCQQNRLSARPVFHLLNVCRRVLRHRE